MKKPPDDLAEKLYGLSDDVLARAAELRIDDIARITGVPRATLYYYFSGKDDLLTYLMGEKITRMGAAVRAACSTDGSAAERLTRAVDAMVRTMSDSPSLCVNMLAAAGQGETMAGLVFKSDEAVFQPLREVLIEGRATGELAADDLDATVAALAGAVLMASLRAYLTDGVIDADVVVPALTTTLVDGLRVRA